MSISGTEYPVSKIFSSEFDYVIPNYQRPYAWKVDQASELFDDLYDFHTRVNDDEYFLGSIVLIKAEGNPVSDVIDGQQRLTTLTILLASIAFNLSGKFKRAFDVYINEPGNLAEDRLAKPRLALRERDRQFFKQYVQDLKLKNLLELEPLALDNESKKNIQLNSKCLLKRINDTFGSSTTQLEEFGKFIVQKCFLVVVSTSSKQLAYRVFSILNNRGLDLLPSDIVKANIVGEIPQEQQEEYTEKWEAIEDQAGRNGFNDLFGYIRMIYVKEKAKRTLLEEFEEHVLQNQEIFQSPKSFIDNVLERYANAYLIVKYQKYVATSNAEDVNRQLGWLNRIDNSDWYPPAILFLSQKKNDSEYLLWFLTKLERLAAYLQICAKNVNERINRYAKVIESLEEQHSLTERICSVELTDAEIQEFKKALNGIVYELTPSRRNYLIHRLDSFLSDDWKAAHYTGLVTIEHVLPQTINDNSKWAITWPDADVRNEWVHRIANLVLLNRSRNSKAQNYDFARKKLPISPVMKELHPTPLQCKC